MGGYGNISYRGGYGGPEEQRHAEDQEYVSGIAVHKTIPAGVDRAALLKENVRAWTSEARRITETAISNKRELSANEGRKVEALIDAAQTVNTRLEEEDRQSEIEESFRRYGRGDANAGVVSAGEARFAAMLRSGQQGRIELRAVSTTNAGARTQVTSDTSTFKYVHEQAGIGFTESDTLTVQSPYWPVPTALSATSEGGSKPVVADPTLKTVSLAAYAATMSVNDQVVRFGVGTGAISKELIRRVIFSVNSAFVSAVNTEAGTALTFAGSAGAMLDLAIAKAEAQTGLKPTAALINSADYSLFTNKLGAESAEGIGSPVVEWNGVPLIVNDTVAAGFALVVVGQGWHGFGTGIIAASLPVLSTNQIQLLAEQYAAFTPMFTGAAIKADLIA